MTEARRRGRPAAGSGPDQRELILGVARQQLAAKGFAGSSLRAIAREAGVDPSLISHYFGDKAGLLVATMQLPFNPLEKILPVLAGDVEGLGVRLVTTFLEAWDPHRDVFSALLRSTFGSGDPSTMPAVQVAQNVVVKGLRAKLSGPDADIRATLAASQVIGMATLRYVARLEPVASAPAELVARWYGPAIQELLTPSAER
ncbi:MAG: TetR family transcriptional regulator [Actinomycetota bacterium]|nr:TetR family transcriptional regulator [Actinomycetota bacterium]